MTQSINKIFQSLCVCLLFGSAAAEVIVGKVVGVADGDTVTVLDATKTQHKIRLSGIDAPEKEQPFGQRSKGNLSRLVFGKQVEVDTEKIDRYGRNVGKIRVGGVDANLEQISAGLAWHYKKYEREQSAEDRGVYARAETAARAARAGLWRDATQTALWDWRGCRRGQAGAVDVDCGLSPR